MGVKEVPHICFSCKNQDNCTLWEQVCNIDEDFIKEAFDYDPSVQSIYSTVSYCEYYDPIGDFKPIVIVKIPEKYVNSNVLVKVSKNPTVLKRQVILNCQDAQCL